MSLCEKCVNYYECYDECMKYDELKSNEKLDFKDNEIKECSKFEEL